MHNHRGDGGDMALGSTWRETASLPRYVALQIKAIEAVLPGNAGLMARAI
jgi:hypothetical protein